MSFFAGSVFIGYGESRRGEFVRRLLLVFYNPFHGEAGTLYWCSPQKRTESKTCCLPLLDIKVTLPCALAFLGGYSCSSWDFPPRDRKLCLGSTLTSWKVKEQQMQSKNTVCLFSLRKRFVSVSFSLMRFLKVALLPVFGHGSKKCCYS